MLIDTDQYGGWKVNRFQWLLLQYNNDEFGMERSIKYYPAYKYATIIFHPHMIDWNQISCAPKVTAMGSIYSTTRQNNLKRFERYEMLQS